MTFGIRRAAALAALAIVALCSAEIAARLDDWIRLGIPFGHTPDYDHDLRYRDWFGMRGRSNGRYKKWQLDSSGFRGPDVARATTQGCTRVMIFGASETFGLYESPGNEYPAQLGDSLRSRGCFEVINAAIAGMGLRNIIRLWEYYGATFRPAVVVVYPSPAFYLSSADPDGWSPLPGKPEVPAELPFRPRIIEAAHNVWATPDFIQTRRVDRWMARDTTGKPASWFFRTVPQARLDRFMSDLDSLVTSIRAHGSIPVLMTHAVRFSDPPDARDDLLLKAWNQFSPRASRETLLAFERATADSMRAEATRQSIALLDVSAALTGKREFFGDAVHFLDAGSAQVAGQLARMLAGPDMTARLHAAGESIGTR